MKEIKSERKNYGGDENAINRHSSRIYEDKYRAFYEIDKTLDGCPPFYELLERSDLRWVQQEGPPSNRKGGIKSLESRASKYCPIFLNNIKVIPNCRYFGDGLTWEQAEDLAKRAIEKFINEILTLDE